MTSADKSVAIEVLLAEGMKMGKAECFYCGNHGCTCGVRMFDQMRDALTAISEYTVDEHADTPRDVLSNIREMAFAGLERTK